MLALTLFFSSGDVVAKGNTVVQEPLPDFVLFLGHLHPVILHFPIGFLVGLFLFEVYALLKSSREMELASWILLTLGSTSAAVAASLGILLSWGGGYDEDIIYWHKRFGVAVGVLSVAAVGLKLWYRRSGGKTLLVGYRMALAVCILFLMAASHKGASLTHGSDYLTRYMPPWLAAITGPENQPLSATLSEGAFDGKILPILESRCFQCHGSSKQESGLRLDSREAALAGGESGRPAIIPNDALATELVRRVTLPREHDDVMPPVGKPGLTPVETLAIIHWINRGAKWSDVLEEIARGVPPASREVLKTLRSWGALVMPLAKNNSLVQVDFRSMGEEAGDDKLLKLAPLADQVTWLNLAGTNVGDAGLKHLSQLQNLTRLHLEKTKVGDVGLAHLKNLEHLEYLNLYGTQVSDGGLVHLERLKRLKELYLWQTQVSQAGAERLKNSLPRVVVNLGGQKKHELPAAERKKLTSQVQQAQVKSGREN